MVNFDNLSDNDRSPKGASPALLRRINVRTIIDALAVHGPRTRAELTRATGISPPTMSKLIQQLEESGWVEADPEPVLTRGRPGIRFRFANHKVRVIGVAIDLSFTEALDSGLDGHPDAPGIRFATPATYGELVDAICEAVHSLKRRYPGSQTPCIALSIPGLIQSESGQVRFCPNLPQLNGRNPAADVGDRLKIPVVADQEMTSLSLAIARAYGDDAPDNLVTVDATEGLGSGILLNRHPFLGHAGYAGEIGHIPYEANGLPCGCGNHGCLETVATDRAFSKAVSLRVGENLDLEAIVGRVHNGKLDPEPDLERVIRALAVGMSTILNLYNPQAVFLLSRLDEVVPDFLDRLRQATHDLALPPSVRGVPIAMAQVDKGEAALASAIERVTCGTGPLLQGA